MKATGTSQKTLSIKSIIKGFYGGGKSMEIKRKKQAKEKKSNLPI